MTVEEVKIKNLNKLAKYRQYLYTHPKLKDLFLEVTSRCNAKCEHCGSSCGEKITEDEISGEDIKNTLSKIAKKYDPKNIVLNITGGEPLLRKDLFDIMSYAHTLGYPWGMTTNGMLINDDIINKMIATNMETISISLDGLKDTHENFRKVPNSFELIINNVKKLLKIPSIKIVQITTVVNKKNIHELQDIYQLLLNLGVKYWRVVNVDPIGRANNNSDILLDNKQYIELFKFIKEKREEGIMQVDYGCSHYLDLPLEKELRDYYFICATGIYVASILSNGDIFICPNVERRKEFIQGNIKEDDFIDVWENKFKIFRDENRTKCDKCQKCSSWNYCCGDSFHTFDFENKKPKFCIKEILEKEKIENERF